jgi:probable F420-dependent oxidoreductase
MPKPFRFGVQLFKLPGNEWEERVRRVEELGYSSLFWPDHFGDQWEPLVALAAAAAVTKRLHIGALVLDVDYRHPVVLAKASATLHLLSGGRHEFGLGAGWMQTDYDEAGLVYDRPGVRIERLEEALQIIRSMWTQEKTSFTGKHYQITEIAQAGELPNGKLPKILVGGGGKRCLSIAGRYADIVGINATMHEGRVTNETARDLAPERVREKISWVREGAEKAGRDPDKIELNSLVFIVSFTDDPKGLRQGLAQNTGMTPEQVRDCPLFLTGPASEIRDRLEKQREETGISYIVIQGQNWDLVEQFAESVVAPLSGH